MLTTLTETDKQILATMFNVVDGIATMFGPQTEVTLHSLDIENPSVIHIQNGHITGRDVGAPITNFALEKIKSGSDVTGPYFSRAADGKLLRSVTTIIRNETGKAIGALCVNFNMDAPLMSIFTTMLPATLLPDNLLAAASPETFANSNTEMIHDSISRIRDSIPYKPGMSIRKLNRLIIEGLFQQGAFEVKNSVKLVAEHLNVSIDMVYRHIRLLREQD